MATYRKTSPPQIKYWIGWLEANLGEINFEDIELAITYDHVKRQLELHGASQIVSPYIGTVGGIRLTHAPTPIASNSTKHDSEKKEMVEPPTRPVRGRFGIRRFPLLGFMPPERRMFPLRSQTASLKSARNTYNV